MELLGYPVGSLADLASLLVLLVALVRGRDVVGTLAAGLVALARRDDAVDHNDLQADLPVDNVDVDAVLVADGGGHGE